MKNLLRAALNRLKKKGSSASPKYGYAGEFQTWESGKSATRGYQDPEIAAKVAAGASAVLEGRAVYERDSIIFSSRQYSLPLAAALMWCGLKNCGTLKVLDFGGGLGTSYFQNLPFLSLLDRVEWAIVEQDSFVEQAKTVFAGSKLTFYSEIEEGLKRVSPDVVLVSSSLQYVEKPYDVLRAIVEQATEMVVFDRTLFGSGAEDFVTRQTVPDEIFSATIPTWIFSEPKFESFMSDRYLLVSRFSSSLTTVSWNSEKRKLEELGFIYVLKGSGYESLVNARPTLFESKK
jgi:putative methyltransferase (TIGR04325 family)